MYAMKPNDRRLLNEYRALGSPDEIKARLAIPYPDNPDLAPLPFSEPDISDGPLYAYENECWDDRTTCGLIEEDA